MMQDIPGGHTVLEAGDAVIIIERDRESGVVRERTARIKFRTHSEGHRGELIVCPDVPEADAPSTAKRLCGSRGFAGHFAEGGCIRRANHKGGHGYADGSGEQDD